MPFTLAHPAAVLPLCRYCPRLLSFPALLAGTISPDIGYAFGRFGWDDLSHRFVGSLVFCLPVGLCVVGLFHALRSRFSPDGSGGGELWRLGPPLAIVVSILIGAWTHLLWDSFTNQHGWVVLHLDILQIGLATVADHTVRICHLLWYLSSFVGVLWIYRACQESRVHRAATTDETGRRREWGGAVVIAALVLPIGALHHSIHGLVGACLVALLSVLLILGAVFRLCLKP
jgi:Domain of unknown function (DUF4184)